MLKIIEGDLIEMTKEGHFDVIVHGCNCFHKMGAGIAFKLAYEFPEVLDADLQTDRGASEKLGTYSEARISRYKNSFTVLNAYTQYHYGKDKSHLNYRALFNVLDKIDVRYRSTSKRIALPLIGGGLAGGEKNKIIFIMEAVFKDSPIDATLVLLKE